MTISEHTRKCAEELTFAYVTKNRSPLIIQKHMNAAIAEAVAPTIDLLLKLEAMPYHLLEDSPHVLVKEINRLKTLIGEK